MQYIIIFNNTFVVMFRNIKLTNKVKYLNWLKLEGKSLEAPCFLCLLRA